MGLQYIKVIPALTLYTEDILQLYSSLHTFTLRAIQLLNYH